MKVIGGNATERAILGFAAGTECSANVKAVGNIPFNSTNKYSATQVTGDYDLTLIKGRAREDTPEMLPLLGRERREEAV